VAGPPLKTSSALGRGRGNAPLPCTPSPNQIQTSKSGSFYLAKNRNFLLGLDTNHFDESFRWYAECKQISAFPVDERMQMPSRCPKVDC